MVAQEGAMTRRASLVIVISVSAAVLASIALAAQDKYTVRGPNGLAFSEFRGYENFQDVAVGQTENGMKVILANPAMIKAYRNGIPGNGRTTPDAGTSAIPRWRQKITFSRRTRRGDGSTTTVRGAQQGLPGTDAQKRSAVTTSVASRRGPVHASGPPRS